MKKILCFLLIPLLCYYSSVDVRATNIHFTRGSFCQKIAETIQDRTPIIDSSAIDNPFPDLRANEEYYEAVLWMTTMGYMNGYPDGTFIPELDMTIGEVAYILVNMLFKDFTVPDNIDLGQEWCAKHLWKAIDSGIMPSASIAKCNNRVYENDINYEKVKEYFNNDEVSIIIDAKRIDFTNISPQPFLKNNDVMVPIRSISESMNVDASWDAKKESIILSNDKNLLELHLDSHVMYINGYLANIDAPPCIFSDRIFLPIRSVAEGLGALVYSYPQINTIIIKNAKNSIEETEDDYNENNFNADVNLINENVIITADITNIKKKKNIHVAIYDKNGKMVDYIIVPSIYSNNTVNIIFKYSTEMFYAKVFIWDSLKTMQPLTNAITLIIKQ